MVDMRCRRPASSPTHAVDDAVIDGHHSGEAEGHGNASHLQHPGKKLTRKSSASAEYGEKFAASLTSDIPSSLEQEVMCLEVAQGMLDYALGKRTCQMKDCASLWP